MSKSKHNEFKVGDIVLADDSQLACRISEINNRKVKNLGAMVNGFFLEFESSRTHLIVAHDESSNYLCLVEWHLLGRDMKLERIKNAIARDKHENWHEVFLKEVSQSVVLVDAVVNELIRLVQRGIRRWGMKTIFEYLRHQSAISDSDKTFKINNSNASGMARLMRLLFPELGDMFQFRNSLGHDTRAA